MAAPSVEARFWAKVDRRGDDECWPWRACTLRGYGVFGARAWGKKFNRAHRFAYELLRGPIPDERVIDHVCRNPRCVNPAHLEIVTVRENTLRGRGFAAVNARKTHCDLGHPLSGENLYFHPSGWRQCRECIRQSKYRYRARLRAEGKVPK